MLSEKWKYGIVVLCLMLSVEASAVGLVEEPIARKTVDVSKYAPDALELRKMLLRVMINSNWTVVEQARDVIRADYDGARIEATINGNVIDLREVRTNERFRTVWLETIQSYLIKEMEYRRQAGIAEALMH